MKTGVLSDLANILLYLCTIHNTGFLQISVEPIYWVSLITNSGYIRQKSPLNPSFWLGNLRKSV